MPAAACDCTAYAYEALKRVGVKIKTVPSIVGTTGQTEYARGVAHIRIPQPCMVYIHEFVHHDQWLHGREAKAQGDAQWQVLEANARAITLRAIEHPDLCE